MQSENGPFLDFNIKTRTSNCKAEMASEEKLNEANESWSAATKQLFEAARCWDGNQIKEALSNGADVKAIDAVCSFC